MALDELILQIEIKSLENNRFLNYSLYESGKLEVEGQIGKTNFKLLESDNRNLRDYIGKLDLSDQMYGDEDESLAPVVGISVIKNDEQRDLLFCWDYKPNTEIANFFKLKQLVRNVNQIAEKFVSNGKIRTVIQNASTYLKKNNYN